MSLPSTRYLYLRWPFFLRKHSWINSLNLSSCLVVYRVEKSNVLILLHEERDLDRMFSNRSLEFFIIHTTPLNYFPFSSNLCGGLAIFAKVPK